MMSDFIEHLINRHLGKGEQVLPRVRSRFETGTAATYLPHEAEEDSKPTPTDAEVLPVNSPAPDTPPVNSIGDNNTIKQPVHDQHQPGTVIEPAEVRTKMSEPESGPVPQPIPGVPAEVDSDNNIVSHHEPLIPTIPAQEAVQKKKGVPKEKPAAHKHTIMNKNRWEHNLENRPDNFLQTVTQQLLQPLEQDPSAGFDKQGNPEKTITINTNVQQGSKHIRFHQHSSAASELSPSPVQPAGLTEPGQVMTESRPVMPAFQNTGTVSEGTLEAPAWLSGSHSELHKELFLNDSKTGTEPVINVTIDRIEVRANLSPAPEQPRKQKKPSGVMSLDQYLNQRTQGGSP